MKPDLDQAREVAAVVAFPDEGYHNFQHTGGWGSRIRTDRVKQWVRRPNPNLAVWRGWTVELSRKVIAEDERRRTAVRTGPPTVIRTCLHCGDSFEVLERLTRRPTPPKYCGAVCMRAARRAPLIDIVCQQCKTIFQIKSFETFRNQKFCSHACHNRHRNQKND